MKKFAVVFYLFLLSSASLKGQDGTGSPPKISLGNELFLKVYGGHAFFTPGSHGAVSNVAFEWKSDRINFVFHDTSRRSHSNVGLGYGQRVGFGIGYIKNDFLNIGIDVEFNQTKGIKSILSINADADNHYTSKDEMDYKLLTITPYVIFKALAKPRYYLYNKLGVLFTLPFQLNSSGIRTGSDKQVVPNYSTYLNGVFYHDVQYTRSATGDYSYDNKDKVKLGIGMNIAFGINFRINTRLRAFAEVFGNYSALTFSNSKSSVSNKYVNVYQVDSTNFHVEQIDKHLDNFFTNTKYRNGGVIGGVSYDFKDLGINNEGYYETFESRENITHKNSINMAAVGISVGLTWRLK